MILIGLTRTAVALTVLAHALFGCCAHASHGSASHGCESHLCEQHGADSHAHGAHHSDAAPAVHDVAGSSHDFEEGATPLGHQGSDSPHTCCNNRCQWVSTDSRVVDQLVDLVLIGCQGWETALAAPLTTGEDAPLFDTGPTERPRLSVRTHLAKSVLLI